MAVDTYDPIQEAHEQTRNKALAAIEGLLPIATRCSPVISQRLTQRYDSLSAMLYKLMMIGRNNIGKSTLLNALLLPLVRPVGGLTLPPLPVDRFRTTALLAWIRYAEEPSCTVWSFTGSQESKSFAWYQRESKLEGDLERDEHRFQGVAEFELGLPSQLCSAAVMFGDSAGLDDETRRDKATLEALPKVDAVLFVIKSTEILGLKEQEYLDGHVKARGIRDIFFLVNVFDDPREPMTPEDWKRMYQEAWERLVQGQQRNTQPYAGQSAAEFARHGVFFVDAWEALRGKLDGDQARVAQSGLADFEAALTAFLVHQRLAAKVHGTVSQTLADATELRADLVQAGALLQADRTKVEQALKEIAQRLAYLEDRRRALEDAFQRDLPDTRQTVQAAFLRELIALRDKLPAIIRKCDFSVWGIIGEAAKFWKSKKDKEKAIGEKIASVVLPVFEKEMNALGKQVWESSFYPRLENMTKVVASEWQKMAPQLEQIKQLWQGALSLDAPALDATLGVPALNSDALNRDLWSGAFQGMAAGGVWGGIGGFVWAMIGVVKAAVFVPLVGALIAVLAAAIVYEKIEERLQRTCTDSFDAGLETLTRQFGIGSEFASELDAARTEEDLARLTDQIAQKQSLVDQLHLVVTRDYRAWQQKLTEPLYAAIDKQGAFYEQAHQALHTNATQTAAQLRQLANEQQTVTVLAQELRDVLTTAEQLRRHV